MAVDLHEDYNLGKALQRIRKHRDWTLAKVAEKTGVAISTLSKLENNQSSPSYDVLIRLAEGLGMGLLELVKSESFSTFAPGARAINRGDKGVQYETPLGEYLALSSELAKKSMQPTLIRLPKCKRTYKIAQDLDRNRKTLEREFAKHLNGIRKTLERDSDGA